LTKLHTVTASIDKNVKNTQSFTIAGIAEGAGWVKILIKITAAVKI